MALKSISGSLASADLIAALGTGGDPPAAIRAIVASSRRVLGPASPPRQIFDMQVMPILREIGLDAVVVHSDAGGIVALFGATGAAPAGAISAGGWGADLRRLRDMAARGAPRVRWWLGGNGLCLRVMDGSRAYARRTLDFDLLRLDDEDAALRILHRILSADRGVLANLETLLAQSARHRVDVGRSLQAGVEDALARLTSGFARARRRATTEATFADALTVVYRILFLLFAEARGLVPQWHPIYRESYTIESLRPLAESPGPAAGLWQSLQAISRLAHRGCTAGSLRVVPFNGRLFAPAAAPLADSFSLDDRVARDVLLAVTTRPGRDRRERVSYADLGVEQLGAVYERVLDFTPGEERRKRSGTFYTPRAMTEFLVRRTLAPLVDGKGPDAILALRVVDPAMGSGAFLVAACRFLADAYEQSLIAEGMVTRADLTTADRASFRRAVAQRCLYGVDVNPTAVQLARLSLWLCTLAADLPLTFLDHHLRAGNSLVGARATDLNRQAPGHGRGRAPCALPLFDDALLSGNVSTAVDLRTALARAPDDTAAVVRGKERTVEVLSGSAGPLARWRACADAWCAAWFWPEGVRPFTPRAWPAFASALRGEASDLPPALEAQWQTTAARLAASERFFHWELEFPEAFFDGSGLPLLRPGFDAVIGNPPWANAQSIATFTRESGCYRLHGRGHANLYQLFAERMLQLAAPGGRVGILMPSGLLADHGCADLRRHLFDRCSIDAVLGFENHEALFPVHRGLRFVLMTATTAGSTPELPLRSGLRSAAVLEDIPDRGDIPGSVSVPMTLIRRFSGADLGVPELAREHDRAILARLLAAAPPLGSPDGWDARFGRELNATEDRRHFVARGLPVLEGNLIEPYRVKLNEACHCIAAGKAARLLGARGRVDRPRLGYREVAASTNRLTLIAAVIPKNAVTTHTIFCLRAPDDEELQWYLCGIFNSFTANYLARLRGGTHVPASAIHRLPVPVVARQSYTFLRIAALARLAADDDAARSEIHARSAAAYGLSADDLVHVLQTFPLVAEAERDAALAAFLRLRDGI